MVDSLTRGIHEVPNTSVFLESRSCSYLYLFIIFLASSNGSSDEALDSLDLDRYVTPKYIAPPRNCQTSKCEEHKFRPQTNMG